MILFGFYKLGFCGDIRLDNFHFDRVHEGLLL